MHNPTPEEIRAARKAAKLTQTAAAALIGKPLRTWQGWETAEGIPSHRKMDPALWELWQIKVAESQGIRRASRVNDVAKPRGIDE